jgi:hypothetical protein
MLQALAEGTTDPGVLADLARGQLRGKLPALRAAQTGRFRPHHAFIVGQLLAHLDFVDEAIGALNREIEGHLAPFADRSPAWIASRHQPTYRGSVHCRGRRRHECLIDSTLRGEPSTCWNIKATASSSSPHDHPGGIF